LRELEGVERVNNKKVGGEEKKWEIGKKELPANKGEVGGYPVGSIRN